MDRNFCLVLVLVLAYLVLSACDLESQEPIVGQDVVGDRSILAIIYEATDGDGWINNDNWLTGAPLNEWHGVTANENERVIELRIVLNGLKGEIPAEISGLTNLEYLDLSGNLLTGGIPPEIGDLGNLQVLNLGATGLGGEIPPEIGKLNNLEELRLYNNAIGGTIPPELGELPNLRIAVIFSGVNSFTGCIPAGFPALKANDFGESGLPFCELDNVASELDREALVEFFLATGGPNWLKNTNWLSSAPIAEWYGITVNANGRVILLALIDNGLTGEIPIALSKLSELERIGLMDNDLVGGVPHELGNLHNLDTLFLSGNWLAGCIPVGLKLLANNDFSEAGLPFCSR